MTQIEFLSQLIVSGMSMGCVYSLVGLGFVIIFKSTKVLNLAQGEMMMLGAYFTLTREHDPGNPISPDRSDIPFPGLHHGCYPRATFCPPDDWRAYFLCGDAHVGLSVAIRGLVGLIWTQEEQILTVPMFKQSVRLF